MRDLESGMGIARGRNTVGCLARRDFRPLTVWVRQFYTWVSSPFHWQRAKIMETEWYNRAESIQQRITQLRDGL